MATLGSTVDLATAPARPDRPNEDYVAVTIAGDAGAVVVLDGVTPPVDGDTGCVHGVPWFTARLGSALLERAGTGCDLVECLAGAIRRAAAAHESTCDLSHRRTPQATVAMVRWDTARVEHLVLSDAAVLLEGPDGTVTAALDGRLDELRPHAGRNIEALRNTPDGFHTAAADPDVAARAVVGTTGRDTVCGAAALTDGATRWTEVFRLGGWAELLAVLRSDSAASLIDRVRAAETEDPDRRIFPRGKVFDDATAVYLNLGHGPGARKIIGPTSNFSSSSR